MDNAIIHIFRESAGFYFWSEFSVNHSLEGGGQIRHSKEHDKWFKQPFRS
jgi:hypothetical protein